MPISTTYQPNSITTQTSLDGMGGGGGGGAPSLGIDPDMLIMVKNRFREQAADRARQRAMERQQFEWAKEDRAKAASAGAWGSVDPLAQKLRSSAARRQLMEDQAATRGPQRELIDAGPGITRGGYLGPDVQRMNAIERNLYAPKDEGKFGGFAGTRPGSQRVFQYDKDGNVSGSQLI